MYLFDRGNLSDEVVSCDCLGTCIVSRLNSTEDDKVFDFGKSWEDLKDPIVMLPKIISKGHRVVFPIKTEIEKMQKPEKTEESDEEDPVEDCSPDDQLDFTHECTIFVFSTMVPTSNESLLSELSIFLEFDFAVACVNEHMSTRGLIVGFAEVSIGSGCVGIWPQYQSCPGDFATVTGTMGKWSPNADMVVTWTVPAEVLPEESTGGSCFLFSVHSLKLVAKELQSHVRSFFKVPITMDDNPEPTSLPEVLSHKLHQAFFIA